jgi:Rhs element Vgr protein
MLIIDCKDEFFKLTIGKFHKSFIDKTDSEVTEELISNYGLENEIEATDVRHNKLVQFCCSDWDFMITRMEANGKICIVSDGKIISKSPSLDADPVLSLLYGETILDFDAVMDARDQFQSIKASAWDPSSQSVLEIDASDPGITGNGNLQTSDLSAVVGLESFELKHTGMLAQDELQAWADAQMLKKQLSRIRGRVGFEGYAAIVPGDIIELGGMGNRMNGKALVSGIRQEISNGTWKTDSQFGLAPENFTQKFQVQPQPAGGLLPGIQGLQIGIVTQLQDDPESQDRIQVKLPIISNDEEGIWARMACMDAGENRGTFFRPEIGDEVVVGFLNDDPRDGVVLGALHSSNKPSPSPATDENHEKGYTSRSEMKLVFNDDKKSILLETPGGKSVLLDEDKDVIKLEDDHGNKILLDSAGITIQSNGKITLKTSGNVAVNGNEIKNTATGSFKAEGSTGIELTSNAIAKLKGSLVQIN